MALTNIYSKCGQKSKQTPIALPNNIILPKQNDQNGSKNDQNGSKNISQSTLKKSIVVVPPAIEQILSSPSKKPLCF